MEIQIQIGNRRPANPHRRAGNEPISSVPPANNPAVPSVFDEDEVEITVVTASPSTDDAGIPIEEGPPTSETPTSDGAASKIEMIYEDEADVDEIASPIARILVHASGQSDGGKVRRRNEDSFLVLPERSLFAVADGMGGHAGGDVASKLAVETLRRAFGTKARSTVAPKRRRPFRVADASSRAPCRWRIKRSSRRRTRIPSSKRWEPPSSPRGSFPEQAARLHRSRRRQPLLSTPRKHAATAHERSHLVRSRLEGPGLASALSSRWREVAHHDRRGRRQAARRRRLSSLQRRPHEDGQGSRDSRSARERARRGGRSLRAHRVRERSWRARQHHRHFGEGSRTRADDDLT